MLFYITGFGPGPQLLLALWECVKVNTLFSNATAYAIIFKLDRNGDT